MFPVGTPAGENGQRPGRIAAESITWSGTSGLNPRLATTDQEAETAAGHDTFVAGISFGIASRTAVAFFGVLWESLRLEEESIGRRSGRGCGKTRRMPQDLRIPYDLGILQDRAVISIRRRPGRHGMLSLRQQFDDVAGVLCTRIEEPW